jgi:OOP family OmpA-OmpF porin
MKIKTAIAIAAFTASTATLANTNSFFANNDSGFVGGLQGGYGQTNWKTSDFDPFSDFISVSDDGFAGRIYVGYDFNKYLGLQTGYTYLPDTDFTINVSNISETETANTYALDLVLKASLPVTDQFSVFAKGGVSYLKASSDEANESNTGLAYGAGVAYQITPNVGVDASWTRYSGKGSAGDDNYLPDADAFLFGVSYKFGQRA